tara:strand:- start:5933 stop:6148 length:216 start_codon:yes stop_codon:yes gene_type:complete
VSEMIFESEMLDVMNDALADNLVEVIANMSQDQRDKFAKTFVSKWPTLAGQISFSIDANLQDSNVTGGYGC